MMTDLREKVSRAIWDKMGGDCSGDCRWGVNASACFCQQTAGEYADVAMLAMVGVIDWGRAKRDASTTSKNDGDGIPA